jgi:hypothetical protein
MQTQFFFKVNINPLCDFAYFILSLVQHLDYILITQCWEL